MIWVFQRKGWEESFLKQRCQHSVLNAIEKAEADGAPFAKIRSDYYTMAKDYISAEPDEKGVGGFVIPSPHGAQLVPLGIAWVDDATDEQPAAVPMNGESQDLRDIPLATETQPEG